MAENVIELPVTVKKPETAAKKLTLTKRGEKVKRVAIASAIGLTGVAANAITHGGVTDAVKEITNFNQNGKEVAKTDALFKLKSFQTSPDSLDAIAPIVRMKPDARFGPALDTVLLEEQGFDLSKIQNVTLELGDEYYAPKGKTEEEQAVAIGKMLQDYFGIDGDRANKFWNFEDGLYHQSYGYWLKGTIINSRTGEEMSIHFTPNFAEPLTPPPSTKA